MRRLGLFIATCGYLGYVPIAPGTFGSAAGLAVFYAVRPYAWKERFPKVNRADRDAIRQVMEKFRDVLPFPKGL